MAHPRRLPATQPPRAIASIGRRRPRLAGLSLSIVVASSLILATGARAAAEPGTRVDVEPEHAQATVNTLVTLTAQARDMNGAPSVGPETNTHVRWFFAAGSANEFDSMGNSPDLQCWTGTVGSCSVSYLAAATGTDILCAVVGGPTSACSEALEGPDWQNRVDVVSRTIVPSTGATPTPTPSTTPSPTPTPIASPTPEPTPEPTPSPSPTDAAPVSPTPTLTPSPTPAAQPTPTERPTPTPSPEPAPQSAPTSPPATPEGVAVTTPPPSSQREAAPHDDAATPERGQQPAAVAAQAPAETPAEASTDSGEPTVAERRGLAAEEPLPVARRAADVGGPASEPQMVPGTPAAIPPAPAAAPVAPMAPTEPSGPGTVVGQVVVAAAAQISRVVRPDAAAAVAAEFTFPLLLALAVLAYLVIQGQIDRRDPKLRMAPQHTIETLVTFRAEDEL